MVSAENIECFSNGHKFITWHNIFAKKSIPKARTVSVYCHANNMGPIFKYCQVKTYVQTAGAIHDLNIDFCSFDNGFKYIHARMSDY